MPSGRATKRFVILHARFPDGNLNVTERNELHPKRIDERLSRRRTNSSFQARCEKCLLLRLNSATDQTRRVTGQPQLIRYATGLYFFDYQRRLTELFSVCNYRRAAWRAGDLHAAIRKNKVDLVFVLGSDLDLLLFVRPAFEVRDQFVRPRRQIHAQRRTAARCSVHKNLSAARFASDTCECTNESERFARGLAALHFDLVVHFPIATASSNGIFAGGKIAN